MKRKVLSILSIILILALASIMVACDSSTSNSGSGNYGGNYNPNTSTYSCSHSWSEATCESPSKCSKCGKTSGSSLGHDWEDATCETPKTCQRCQETSGEVLDHNYVDGVCSMCEQLDPETEQFNSGKTVYDKLNAINSISATMASSIYDAWYFAIYEYDDYSAWNTEKAITDFAVDVGLKREVVVEAIDQYLTGLGYTSITETLRLAVLGTNSGAINTVLIAYENTGITKVIDENFATVKSLLKDMSSDYEEITYYSTLKDYYSDSLAYYNFVTSPSGSFSQLATTLNGHTSKLVEHKNDLSFIYEE